MPTTYTENPNKKVYCVDYDHTLTKEKKGEYSTNPLPNIPVIQKVKSLYLQGHIIIIWSARPWKDAARIASWLVLCGVQYHGLRMEKGGGDYYLDDKSISFEEFLK